MPFMWLFLGPTVIGLCYVVFSERNLIQQFFQLKTTRNGLSMGSLVFISLGFLILINFISVRYNQIYDYSTTGSYTLSTQSQKIIQEMKGDLEVYYFYKENTEGEATHRKVFSQAIEKFKEYSNKVKVQYIEVNSRPQIVKEFDVQKGQGEVYLRFNKKIVKVDFKQNLNSVQMNEQDLTNGIVKVTRTSSKKIYFLKGHKERDWKDDGSKESLSLVKSALEKNSFVVDELNLVISGKIPDDASALFVIDPQQQLQSFELALLNGYLKKGGSLLIAFDQNTTTSMTEFVQLYGVRYKAGLVFNVLNSQMGPVVNADQPTVAVQYSVLSEITKMFSANQATLFWKPQHFEVLSVPEKLQSDILIKSPEASVVLENEKSTDYQGDPQSYNLAVLINGLIDSDSKQEMKLLLFSDADFMSNSYLNQNNNKDLLLNSASYLTGEMDLIAISPKDPTATPMKLTIPEFNQFYKFIVVGLFIPLPFIFLIISAVLWFRRKNA